MSETFVFLAACHHFCLEMMDYNCCGVPESKGKKLSLSKKKLEKSESLSPSTCFNTTVSNEKITTSVSLMTNLDELFTMTYCVLL